MLEPTKKRPTEIELRFKGPESKRHDAVEALRQMGFVTVEDATTGDSWKTAFPGLLDNEPGIYLAGARHREGLTQRQLGEQSGIPQRHISEMENGKRTIGKENAKKLAAALKADYRVFL
ncbi:helix-turn-helix domain-containing protein [Desulfobulbus rhabdoformis]|uniref:helix-turn-helix domain-containing protein n=1 Tax=Desulfobulbus rhabdoformis TaxID=34032 RepID=UPI001F058C18|nr:helix-turn-helix transcriptional regulator [Desulfobulbus rhabdoformis]